MNTIDLRGLANLFAKDRSVTFSFLTTTNPAVRQAVTLRECDAWDQADAEAEGNFNVKAGDGYLIGYPRTGVTLIKTELRFENGFAAASAVLNLHLSAA